MPSELASRRFTKRSFGSRGDWPSHPPTQYTCPFCAATTELTRADLDSALDRQAGHDMKAALARVREETRCVPSDWLTAVCRFRCTGCGASVLLGFEVTSHRGGGRYYSLWALLETSAQVSPVTGDATK